MIIEFEKYHGTGNDFILVDNRITRHNLSKKQVKQLCDRRFGIGADGLMLLENHKELDFEMRYFNADGAEASLCGNGGRCIVAFARKLQICSNITEFMAYDGKHEAIIYDTGIIDLKMNEVREIDQISGGYFANTGSPHFVKFIKDVDQYDVIVEGRKIRNDKNLASRGCNANFVERMNDGSLKVRTYERGVENETLSCGTGAVASAISAFLEKPDLTDGFEIKTRGGMLSVRFKAIETGLQLYDQRYLFTDIWLSGPARVVFSGSIDIE